MSNIDLFPAGIRLFPNSGGLPGLICVRYTCPKCGASLSIETDQEKEAKKRLAKYQKTHKCNVKRQVKPK